MRNNAPTARQTDGHEAYRDDAAYTAPEMRPGHGENLAARRDPGVGVVTGAIMAMPAGGSALVGEVLSNPGGIELPHFEPSAGVRSARVERSPFGSVRHVLAA